jgi:hypothetical protein
MGMPLSQGADRDTGADGGDEAPAVPPEPPTGTPRRRWVRVVRWMGVAVGVAVLLVVLALALGPLWLESGSGQRWIQGAAAEEGVALDYDRLAVRPLSGRIELEGLRLAMPEPHAHVAGEWLTLGRLEILWSPYALLGGRLHLQRILLEGIRVHVVVDEDGQDSFSLFLRGLPEDPELDEDPPVPLSHTLADLDMPLPIVLDELTIRDVQARLTELLGPGRTRRSTLDGLELTAWLRLDGPLEAEVVEGSTERAEGTRLTVVDSDGDGERMREIDLHLSNRITVRDGRTVTHGATADVLRQTFDPDVDLTGRVLSAETVVRFVPEQDTTRFELSRFALLDDVATATLALEVRDAEVLPRLEAGDATLLLDPLVALIPERFGTFVSEGARFDVQVLPPEATDAAAGHARVQVRGRAERLGADMEGLTAHLASLSLELDADVAPGHLRGSLTTTVDGVAAGTPEASVELGDLALTAHARDLYPGSDDVTGRVGAEVTLASLRAQADGDQVETGQAHLELALELQPGGVLQPNVHLALGETRAAVAPRTRVRVAPLTFDLSASGVTADLDRPVLFEGRGAIPRIQADTGPGERTVLEAVDLTLEGRYADDTPVEVRLGTRVGSVLASSPDGATRVKDADVSLDLSEARLDDGDPLASTATLALAARAGRVELSDAEGTVSVDGPGASVEGRYRGREPSSFTGTLGMRGAGMARGGRSHRIAAAGEITWSLEDLVVDADRPLQSRARFEASGRLAPFVLDAEGQLAKGDGRANVHLRVESFEPLAPLLDSSGMADLDLAGSGMELHGRGTWKGLDSDAPELDHHLEANVSKVGIRKPGMVVHLPRIGVVLDHRGRGLDHHATLRAEVERPEVDHQALDGTLTLAAKVDVDGARGFAQLESTLGGPGGLDVRADAEATLSLDGRVQHTETLTVGKLGGLAPLMPAELREAHPVDLDAITFEARGQGSVDGMMDTAPEGPATATAFQQTLEGTLRGLRYTPEGLTVEVQEAGFVLAAHGDGDRLTTDLELRVPKVDVEDVTHHITVHDMRQEVRFGSRGEGPEAHTTVAFEGSIARIEQDFASAYPMGDLTLTGHLIMDGPTSVELEDFELRNGRGGTTLELHKSLTRAAGADTGATRGLAIRGKLTQDLARIDGEPKELEARGHLTAPFTVDSGDGALFRIEATLELDDVDVELPGMDIIVEGLQAKVPMEEAVEWTPEGGLVVVADTERNVFARVRFQDVQPFLSGNSHLEVRRFHWRHVEVGPVVGSMRVEGNVFSVDKLKIQKDEALISGQLVVDYLPGAERIKFRGNVTGLRPHGSNDPLDANAAVEFDPNRLELDGRLQIVRVSRKHLKALLDLIDPYREDPSMNSLRGALKYGFPKKVSIGMSQGLMSMKVDMGGIIGSFIKLGEIQGVPLGPFMNRHVAPLMPW